MESTNISKLDVIIRKLYLIEKKVERIHRELVLSRVEKMKTIQEEQEKEEFIQDCGKIEPW